MLNEALLLANIDDAATLKAGKSLANTSKWLSRFAHENALWGNCQGSGTAPYFTQIDIQNLAFKCNCPSRKFPCKHGVGLAFLFLNEKNAFVETSELDDRVGEWLGKRGAKKITQNTDNEEVIINLKAEENKLKRADTRMRQVDAGVLELRQWLEDQVRTGIMDIPSKIYIFTQNIKARMVDAKAGGLAAALRNLEEINFFEEGWQVEFMRQISRLYLLLDTYDNFEKIPETLQQDVKSLMGWTNRKEDVLQTQSLGDQWVVLSRQVQEEDKGLTSERCWLWGIRSNRPALILNFFGGYGPPLGITHAAGTTVIGDLCFYPSTFALRALFAVQNETSVFQPVKGFENINTFKSSLADLMARFPFLEDVPVALSNVKLYIDEKNIYIADNQDTIIFILNKKDKLLPILAWSGGEFMNIFGLYKNNKIELLSAWIGKQFYEI
jgi:hypothetical protein